MKVSKWLIGVMVCWTGSLTSAYFTYFSPSCVSKHMNACITTPEFFWFICMLVLFVGTIGCIFSYADENSDGGDVK